MKRIPIDTLKTKQTPMYLLELVVDCAQPPYIAEDLEEFVRDFSENRRITDDSAAMAIDLRDCLSAFARRLNQKRDEINYLLKEYSSAPWYSWFLFWKANEYKVIHGNLAEMFAQADTTLTKCTAARNMIAEMLEMKKFQSDENIERYKSEIYSVLDIIDLH